VCGVESGGWRVWALWEGEAGFMGKKGVSAGASVSWPVGMGVSE
jgi:hypothetical protein